MYKIGIEFGCLIVRIHSYKQDKQCTYSVTLRSVRATLLEWERNNYYRFWVCVCSLTYPACNAHAPYCHL